MATQAQFGQNNVPDPNTQAGWTVQGGGQVTLTYNVAPTWTWTTQ